MARKAKAKTRVEQMAENIDRLVRERDEARACTLRERLAQMGEVARNAAEPTFGGRWTCSRERHDGHQREAQRRGRARQRVPGAEGTDVASAGCACRGGSADCGKGAAVSKLTQKRKVSRMVALRALKAARALFPNSDDDGAVDAQAVAIAKAVLGETIDGNDIANAKEIGADRSDKPRRFRVCLDRNVVGCQIVEGFASATGRWKRP